MIFNLISCEECTFWEPENINGISKWVCGKVDKVIIKAAWKNNKIEVPEWCPL